jgi:lipopolysaccharide transport system ATP-binding protein
VITAENVWKRYRRRTNYRTLREALMERLRRPFGGTGVAEVSDAFWALRDISLAVRRGEAFGIVGPNGSGKTTLLKLLAGISLATRGTVSVRGRVGSLIELGAGFHPELTGRENIFLNGAILGMPREGIRRRLDEIVAFAEVGEFLEMPLKRYSSGMVVRLGFAVAAHVSAEVLLMDEVLSVGDARFQQRCLGRLRQLRQEGVTTVLVSHNLPTVGLFCERAAWLQRGEVVACGPAGEVIEAYQRDATRMEVTAAGAQDGEVLIVEDVRLLNGAGEQAWSFRYQDDLRIRLSFRCRERLFRPAFTLTVRGTEGRLFQASMLLDGRRPETLAGRGVLECIFRRVPLAPGSYHIVGSAKEADGVAYVLLPRVVGHFTVEGDLAAYGWAAERAEAFLPEVAPVIVDYAWQIHEPVGDAE